MQSLTCESRSLSLAFSAIFSTIVIVFTDGLCDWDLGDVPVATGRGVGVGPPFHVLEAELDQSLAGLENLKVNCIFSYWIGCFFIPNVQVIYIFRYRRKKQYFF